MQTTEEKLGLNVQARWKAEAALWEAGGEGGLHQTHASRSSQWEQQRVLSEFDRLIEQQHQQRYEEELRQQQQWEDDEYEHHQREAEERLALERHHADVNKKVDSANSPPGKIDKAMSQGIVLVFKNCLEAVYV
jgi:hypothetical protein